MLYDFQQIRCVEIDHVIVGHKVTAKDQVDGGKSQQLRFVGDILDESNGPQLPELYT